MFQQQFGCDTVSCTNCGRGYAGKSTPFINSMTSEEIIGVDKSVAYTRLNPLDWNFRVLAAMNIVSGCLDVGLSPSRCLTSRKENTTVWKSGACPQFLPSFSQQSSVARESRRSANVRETVSRHMRRSLSIRSTRTQRLNGVHDLRKRSADDLLFWRGRFCWARPLQYWWCSHHPSWTRIFWDTFQPTLFNARPINAVVCQSKQCFRCSGLLQR